MDLDQVLRTFIAESREVLAEMETALLRLDVHAIDAETVNAIFRAAHTIKGSAGLFGLDYIVAFTHVVESTLDQVRYGKVEISEELVTLLLSSCDHIKTLIDAVDEGLPVDDEESTQRGAPLMERLGKYIVPDKVKIPPQTKTPVEWRRPDAELLERLDNAPAEGDNWHISLRFGREVLRNGTDPLSFIRYLERLGTIVGIVTVPDAIPSAEEMDPESCYLGFEMAFKSDADKSTIESVFEFVRDDCSIRILPPNSRISEYVRMIRELPEETARLGEMLVTCGTVTARELDAALNTQSDATYVQPIGAILIEQRTVQPAVVEAALAKQEHVKDQRTQEGRSIRVDAAKLDYLINLVGELIIAAASTTLIAGRARVAELRESTSTLSRLIEEVRDSALQLRMVKIRGTFDRFQRVVHDVARELGKDIGLVVSGEDTELDKTVVEKIGDPLTHLVRNAMDHGIESAELRASRGKPVKGTVRLNAYHDSGNIVIEVSDDGGGLRRDKILAKAVERGLVEPGRSLSDKEIYGLVFEPGFSTADEVTSMSGRGVGMDVVNRNIAELRGSVDIHSEEGVGTTVSVRLPLTLAIINGFLFGLGKSTFVVPLDMVEECLEFSAAPGHDYTDLRGQVLPFIRLRELFEVEGNPGQRQNIVVVKHAAHKVGLVVDTLLGESQAVIKPLNRMFKGVKCISGSSILGSGEVALILDVPALVQLAGQVTEPGPRSAEAVVVV